MGTLINRLMELSGLEPVKTELVTEAVVEETVVEEVVPEATGVMEAAEATETTIVAEEVVVPSAEEEAEAVIAETAAAALIAAAKARASNPAASKNTESLNPEVTKLELDPPFQNSGISVEDKPVRYPTPGDVKSQVSQRISELRASIEKYDEKGYNDESVKVRTVTALETIQGHLAKGTLDGFTDAQIFFNTLMSPITGMFPPKLVKFLAQAKDNLPQPKKINESAEAYNAYSDLVKAAQAGQGKGDAKVQQQAFEAGKLAFTLGLQENPFFTASDEWYKWGSGYLQASGASDVQRESVLDDADFNAELTENLGEGEYQVAAVEKLPRGEYVKRKPDAKKVYIVGEYDKEFGRFRLDDADDISRDIMVKPGTLLVFGFTY